MRHATLLFNPRAGRGGWAVLSAVTEALRGEGIEAISLPTAGPGSAGEQAREAARRSEIVFACGGDGTVHEVVQGLAGQRGTALGIVPLGSANVMARHLRIPLDAVQAALAQAEREVALLHLPRIEYQGERGWVSRLFLVAAGAGADGLLAQRTSAGSKGMMGRWAYPLHAGRIALGGRLSPFEVRCTLANGAVRTELAISVISSQVESLGGLLRPMVRRGSRDTHDLGVTLVRPPSRLSLPAWFAGSWTGWGRLGRWHEHLLAEELECSAGLTAPVPVQADGEWLGYTPMRLLPNADVIPVLAGHKNPGQPA